MEANSEPRTVLILGGSGYLGYHIALDLYREFRVVLYDRVAPQPVWRRHFLAKNHDASEDDRLDRRIIHVHGDVCDFGKLS